MKKTDEPFLSVEESRMILELLDQVRLNPTAPGAVKSVALVQSVVAKVAPLAKLDEAERKD